MSADTQIRQRIDTYDRFVQHITGLCENVPERRAALRRCLGRPPEQAYGMHATVAPWLPEADDHAEEYALYSVAAMIAAQVRSGQPGTKVGTEADDDQGAERAEEGQTNPGNAADASEKEAASGGVRRPHRASIGNALAQAVNGVGARRSPIGKATAEKRLHLLVRQDLPGLHRQLPGLVRHIRSLDVPIDWAQLIDDLRRWGHGRDFVAKRWLQDFYRNV